MESFPPEMHTPITSPGRTSSYSRMALVKLHQIFFRNRLRRLVVDAPFYLGIRRFLHVIADPGRIAALEAIGVDTLLAQGASGGVEADLAARAVEHERLPVPRRIGQQRVRVRGDCAGNAAIFAGTRVPQVEQGIAARREGVKRFRCQFHGLLLRP